MAITNTNRRLTSDQPSDGQHVDPTQNVKDLTEAANLRQDDLRKLNNKRIDAELKAVRNEIQWLQYVQILRADHAREIRLLESERLDKIRQVDVLAGNTAADRALVAIQTLAATTTANADTLRSMVANTATTIAAQTSETVSQITQRIAQLEKSSYEGAGKQAVADPMMAEFVAEMKLLRSAQTSVAGQKTGANNLWILLSGIAAIIIMILGLFVAYLTLRGKA